MARVPTTQGAATAPGGRMGPSGRVRSATSQCVHQAVRMARATTVRARALATMGGKGRTVILRSARLAAIWVMPGKNSYEL